MKIFSKQVIFSSAVLLTALIFILMSCGGGRSGPPKILVFSKTAGFVHSSIPAGIAAMQKIGKENGIDVDTTSNADLFNEDNLSQYATVVFLNTTGDLLNTKQEAAFERYIQAGGGFMGVHSATDTEYGWNWYGKLVGAYFSSHPATQEATFHVEDHEFGATSFFTEDDWTRTDELYNFKKMNPDVNVILSVDEKSYEGGANGDSHPMSWYHEYDGGRAFYTALGHTEESYEEEAFLKHLLGGLKYSIGDNAELDYSKAYSQLPPDGNRFSKVILSSGEFFEPTEMAILPNKDVLVAQRRGELMLYDHDKKELSQVGFLDVYHASGVPRVNAEEGWMGLQKDPNFAENNWIYAYYAPTGDAWINRLSRFKFKDGVFDKDSEQVILDVESTRKICCHTGGSIAFDGEGNLFLSTGDNSTPFDEPEAEFVNNGFAPLNDEPGKIQYDAQRSSGNTNDLRGKIMRIKVNEDGSYDIPEGNLFPVGMEKTRPEIYTMGHRNPYRISVDPKTGYLYWGDVGPDSRQDAFDTRGPMGYDEMNQAKTAGNYGWPMFIADNKAYHKYNYKTGEFGREFNAEAPINDSRNNTGLRELPPAQSAMIYYNYGANTEIAELESGGRNAMAGPTHYKDLYNGENALPDYYDGKVILYDWIRGWMKAAHFFPNGDFNKIEAFAPEIVVNNLIDMEIGEDGTIYLLEYGSGWFAKNADSGLGFIAYNGANRPPVIREFSTDKMAGTKPFSITATVDAFDQEEDAIEYIWDLGDGTTERTVDATISHSYDEAGDYMISVEAVDDEGELVKSRSIIVTAGNSIPDVDIAISGSNSTFYLPGVPFDYDVTVNDHEDSAEGITPANVFVTVDYLDGFDEASLNVGHQQISTEEQGKNLTQALDCRACHKAIEKSVGPSYSAVADKYKNKADMISYLQGKIIGGSTGVWGEVAMPGHPDLKPQEANQIAIYIKSLLKEKTASLPAKGTFTPETNHGDKTLVMTASYADRGGEGAKSLTGIKKIALKSNVVSFGKNETFENFNEVNFANTDFLIVPREAGWFAIADIDLSGVSAMSVTAGWRETPKVGMKLEARLNGPEGEVIGTGTMTRPKAGSRGGEIKIKLKKAYNVQADKIYFLYNPSGNEILEEGSFIGLSAVSFSGN